MIRKALWNQRAQQDSKKYRESTKVPSINRLCLLSMRDVKGCFVCSKDHLDCERHGSEEISEAIERVNAKQPTAVFTIEDLATTYEIDGTADKVEDDEELDDHVQWVEDDVDNFAFIDTLVASNIEQHLTMSEILHGGGLDKHQQVSDITCLDKINSRKTAYDRLRIDTFKNKTSVISIDQYKVERETFRLPFKIKSSKNK